MSLSRLAGYHPFDVYGETPEPELLRKIQAGHFDFDDEVWTQVSPTGNEERVWGIEVPE